MVATVRLKRKPSGSEHRDWIGYRVKLFRPTGVYPTGTFCTPGALFHADHDVAFAVTSGKTWRHESFALPYSEADWLAPELLRLLGALMFTERFPTGLRCWFYPATYGEFLVEDGSLDTADPLTARSVKRALERTVDNRLWPSHVRDFWMHYAEKEFHLFDRSELREDLMADYWHSIDTSNYLLLRGIQALIKSDMLAMHPEFLEESSIATFIALDASFQLVLRHLRATGLQNPTAKDAGTWVYETFDKPLGVHGGKEFKFYEEFYEDRVQTLHPASRYGDMPFAPVSVSDRRHLRQSLPSVLSYLALGRHAPTFLADARHV